MTSLPPAAAPSFAALIRIPAFRWLWLAECQSTSGDQLARVALAVLVYARTGSSLATAGTYALTFVPAIVGGTLLSFVADRYSRRTVMVAADLLRAVLLAAMAVPRVPLLVLATLIVVVVLAGAPFTAAQGAVVPAILAGNQYVTGQALRTVSGQGAQLLGFAGGGVVVTAVGVPGALLIDAATFVLSAAVLRLRLAPHHPVVEVEHAPRVSGLRDTLGLLALDGRLRALLFLAWLIGFSVIVEGVAVPLARQMHGGTVLTGIIMAASPAGSAVGAVAVGRFMSARRRARLVIPFAIGSGTVLIGFAFHPGPVIGVILLFLSGLLAAYLLQVTTTFTLSVPDSIRGQAIGIASAGLLAAQGLAITGGGLLSDAIGPARAIAVGGVCGALCAAATATRLGVSAHDFEHTPTPAKQACNVSHATHPAPHTTSPSPTRYQP